MNAALFHQAVADGDATRVKFLINIGQQARVNQINKQGFTALQQSCKDGKVDVVNVLLNHGANTALTGRTNRTALHYAAAGGFREIVELLISSCADVSAKDGEGKLAVDVAKTTEIVEVLANAEAEKKAKSRERSNSRTSNSESEWGQSFKSLPAGSRNSLVSNSSSDSGVFTEESSSTTTTPRDSKTTTTTKSSNGNSRGLMYDNRPTMGVLNEGEESHVQYKSKTPSTMISQSKLRRSMSERLSTHQRKRTLGRIGKISEELSALNLARLESQEYGKEERRENERRKTDEVHLNCASNKVSNETGFEATESINNTNYNESTISPGDVDGESAYDNVVNELQSKNSLRKRFGLKDCEDYDTANNNNNYVSPNNDSLLINQRKDTTDQEFEGTNAVRKHSGLTVCENNTTNTNVVLPVNNVPDVAINQRDIINQNLEQSGFRRKHSGLRGTVCDNNNNNTNHSSTNASISPENDLVYNDVAKNDNSREIINPELNKFEEEYCTSNNQEILNEKLFENEQDEEENTDEEEDDIEDENGATKAPVSAATAVCFAVEKDEGWEDDDTMEPSTSPPIIAERLRDEAPQARRPRCCDELDMYRRSQRKNMRQARRRTLDMCEVSVSHEKWQALEPNEAAHANNGRSPWLGAQPVRRRSPSFGEEFYRGGRDQFESERNYHDPYFAQRRTTRANSSTEAPRFYETDLDYTTEFNNNIAQARNTTRPGFNNHELMQEDLCYETDYNFGYTTSSEYGTYSCVTRTLSTGSAIPPDTRPGLGSDIGQYYRHLERMSELNNLYMETPDRPYTMRPSHYGRSYSAPARDYCGSNFEAIQRPNTSNLPSYEESLRRLGRERPVVARRPSISSRQVSQV